MKYIFKALIDGVVSIVKLVVVLYALWWCYDTGVVNDIINYFKQYEWNWINSTNDSSKYWVEIYK